MIPATYLCGVGCGLGHGCRGDVGQWALRAVSGGRAAQMTGMRLIVCFVFLCSNWQEERWTEVDVCQENEACLKYEKRTQ